MSLRVTGDWQPLCNSVAEKYVILYLSFSIYTDPIIKPENKVRQMMRCATSIKRVALAK